MVEEKHTGIMKKFIVILVFMGLCIFMMKIGISAQASELTDASEVNSNSDDSGNYMIADVNGEYCEFQIKTSEIKNDEIQVVYECYDVRGDELYEIKLYFDKRIEEGNYSSDNGDEEFKVSSGMLRAQSEVTGTVMGAKVPVQEGAGSFSLDLTYRSDDWTAYAGTFSAVLGRTSNSGTYGDSSMSIEDAEFSFIIGSSSEESYTGNVESSSVASSEKDTWENDGQNTYSSTQNVCSWCGGDGEVTCSVCQGSGENSSYKNLSGVTKAMSKPYCETCNGDGVITCGRCHGSGVE